MITFPCPSCGEIMTIADRYAGKQGRCKSCGATVTAPAAPLQTPEKPVNIDNFATSAKCPHCGRGIDGATFTTAEWISWPLLGCVVSVLIVLGAAGFFAIIARIGGAF